MKIHYKLPIQICKKKTKKQKKIANKVELLLKYIVNNCI